MYDYTSDDGDVIEIFCSIKDERPEFLMKSGKRYNKTFSVPNVCIDSKKPKTIGSLAQKNTERMIKEGKIKKPKEKQNPFWRPNKKKCDVSLANLSEAGKKKYIMEGKK